MNRFRFLVSCFPVSWWGLLVLVVWLLWGTSVSAEQSSAASAPRVLDLSHAFDEHTIYWPTEEGFRLERGPSGETPGGYYYEAHRFRSAEHGGTHLDAPIHFSDQGLAVEQIPLQRLIGTGVVVDVEAACAENRDYRLQVEDLEAWERVHGRIPDDAIVLIRTGFARHWPDRLAYLGTARRGPEGVAGLHFPGLDSEAARFLVEQRKLRAVGIDTASIDPGISTGFEAHRVLAANQVPIFENLAPLDQLPARGFEVIALPMKIRGGSGAPLRIVARLR